MKSVKYIILSFQFAFFLVSCEDFVDVDNPKKELTSETIFKDDGTATAAVTGLYFKLWSFGWEIASSTGWSSDELVTFSSSIDRRQFVENNLISENSIIGRMWELLYSPIFESNALLEGLAGSTALSESTRLQVEGEARFMRSFCYFYLINLFGDVPLITGTDYRVNALEPRAETNEIYQLIIEDLLRAQELLGLEYPTLERVRANEMAVTALLARVYLYNQNWSEAEAQAAKVIGQNDLYDLNTDLNQVFLANSSEAILQFFPVEEGINTQEGFFFIPRPRRTPRTAALSEDFTNSFEFGDQRRIDWIASVDNGSQVFYYPFKYKVRTDFVTFLKTEYSTVLGLAEQYLIRAESRAHLDNLAGAQEDLNVIRNRANLDNTTANDKASILLAVEQERKAELFTEWGHRWFDLRRSNRADQVLNPVKLDWQSTDVLYPIPFREITNNPNITQNSGYNN